MNQALKKFIIKEIFLTGFIILIAALIFWKYPTYYHPVYFLIPLFFLGITTIVHKTLLNKNEQNPNAFPRTFLAITSIKMFLVFVVLVIFVLLFREYVIPTVILFAIHYLAFQVAEIMSILKEIKKNKEVS